MDLIKKSSAGAEVITVDVVAAKDLLHHALYRYLDVRQSEEPKFVDQVLAVSGKEDHLLVGCQSGVRSVYATTDLLEAEFKHVCNMGGGYIAWIGNGFAVKKPNPVEL
ncbi:UNVERIFIED_CONTAM: Thiosulfate sulfurtransferase 18 [Sesamum calycinum]|uniref:Thiosulfate sulfurtransferase 18 n=1 Tax=Sesamum calycinum TaxID=2727403 RepID=A0AAW2MMF1_9LAMI